MLNSFLYKQCVILKAISYAEEKAGLSLEAIFVQKNIKMKILQPVVGIICPLRERNVILSARTLLCPTDQGLLLT